MITVVVATVLIALTWGGTLSAIRAHRTEAEGRVGAEVAMRALVLEEQLRGQLRAVDQTLRLLALEWRRDPADFDLGAWQRNSADIAAASLEMFLADSDGVVRASTRPGLWQADISKQDYFRAAAALPVDDQRMVISAIRRGPVAREWLTNLVHRLNKQDGSFGGIIGASYNTDALASYDLGDRLGSEGIVALVGATDATLHILAGPTAEEPNSISGTKLFSAISDDAHGTWIGPTAPDGSIRIVAFRQVPNRDLIVVVAAKHAEALSPTRTWARKAWGFAAGITVLLLLVTGLLLRLDSQAREREAVLARDRSTLTAKGGQLGATLAGMSDGIMMVDADLRLLEWNDNFPAFTGVPREILRVGLPMEEILRAQTVAGEFGPVDVEAEVARRMTLLRSGHSTGTIQRPRPGGRVLELRRNPLPGGGFVTLYTDVTGRYQAEQRLQQAQKMAAVGRLTAGVAHDFNNLLATIIGSVELTERQVGNEPAVTRRLAVILQAAGRGADLVQQLLAFARKQPLEPVPVDLNQIVQGMTELLRVTLGAGIRLDMSFATGLWPSLVDPVQMEHVILNLAINARDAMPNGGVLKIATANAIVTDPRPAADLVPGDYVTVALTDTGIGMTAEVLRNVFEPFFTTKPPGRGSGLGLSQVYGIASQSGGGVQIDSAPGVGTTVTVYLPRTEAEARLWQGMAGSPVVGSANSETNGRTIMLLEAATDVRTTLTTMLTSAGFAVRTAENSDAALRMANLGLPFDVVLLDIATHGAGGVELAAALRARRPGLSAVFISGVRDDPHLVGERWVIVKPFLTSTLTDMLHNAIAAAPGPQPLSRVVGEAV